MENPANIVVFGKKTMEDIYKEIYENSKTKEKQISTLIKELQPFVTSTGEATLIVPLIKEYMSVSIKNDENLIKLATILQKAFQNEDKDNGLLISEDEKKQLLDTVKSLKS